MVVPETKTDAKGMFVRLFAHNLFFNLQFTRLLRITIVITSLLSFSTRKCVRLTIDFSILFKSSILRGL
jgi:hypothetical protein